MSCFNFRVITLNLRFGLAEDGINGWQYRKNAYAPFLKEHAADFYGFQEANDFQTDFIGDLLPEHDFIGKRTPAPEYWQNNIIFFHLSWKCIHSSHLFLSPTPTVPSRFEGSKWPRQCTIGLFEKAGRTLACITTHLDFSSAVQEKSAHVILEAASNLPAGTPVILVGDFNTDPSSPCYRVFTEKKPSGGLPFQNTFHAPFPATFHGFTGEPKGQHIDWILYRGTKIRPVQRHVLPVTYDKTYLSDHFPLSAHFKFK